MCAAVIGPTEHIHAVFTVVLIVEEGNQWLYHPANLFDIPGSR
jgi:hypothetical protein